MEDFSLKRTPIYGPPEPKFEDLVQKDDPCEVADELRRVLGSLKSMRLDRSARSCIREMDELLIGLQCQIISKELRSVQSLNALPPQLSEDHLNVWLLPKLEKTEAYLVSSEFLSEFEPCWVETLKEVSRDLTNQGGGTVSIDFNLIRGNFLVSLKSDLSFCLKEKVRESLSDVLSSSNGWIHIGPSSLSIWVPTHKNLSRFRIFELGEFPGKKLAYYDQCTCRTGNGLILNKGTQRVFAELVEDFGAYWAFPRESQMGAVIAPSNFSETEILNFEQLVEMSHLEKNEVMSHD